MTREADARESFRSGWKTMLARKMTLAPPLFEAAAARPEYREQALMAMGSCQLHSHNIGADPNDPAMTTYRRLVAEYPNSFDHWRSLGDAWLDCSDDAIDLSPEPVQCFQNALRLRPDSADAWYGLAMLYQHQGNFTQAVDAYCRVIELDAGNIAARFRLWTLACAGRVSEAAIPASLRVPTALEEFSGANTLEALKSFRQAATGTRGRVAILRGFLDDIPFDDIARGLGVFETSYVWPANSRPPTLKETPAPERQILMEAIDDRLAAQIPKAWSDWPSYGFLPHRHDDDYWFVQFPEYGKARGTPSHQDHPLYSQESDWATFWIPFTPCGPGVAPTIRVSPMPLLEPIDPEEPHRRINRVPRSLIKEYFDSSMVTIAAQPGDVVVFDRYVLHDTLVEPSMPYRRISVDVRYTIGPARLSEPYCNEVRELMDE